MVLFSIFLLFSIIALYMLSVVGAGMYFDKECYAFKIIYLIAAIMPFWNTYFAIKYIASDYGSVKEAILYHFTWSK